MFNFLLDIKGSNPTQSGIKSCICVGIILGLCHAYSLICHQLLKVFRYFCHVFVVTGSDYSTYFIWPAHCWELVRISWLTCTKESRVHEHSVMPLDAPVSSEDMIMNLSFIPYLI